MSLTVYVGWDPREDISYQVCEHSIKRRDPGATVIPLKQKDMRASGMYRRDIDRLATTEFTFTPKVGQCSVTVILFGKFLQQS